ncbi:MAG: arginine--tRNA ligase [Burkholderiaceae bacterium]
MVLEQQQIIDSIIAAVAALGPQASADVQVVLERPKVAEHGDLACNIAMQLARPLKRKPRELAEAIVTHLKADARLVDLLEGAEVAGPGFINLRLRPAARQHAIRLILAQGDAYGRSDRGHGEKTLVEFVSANPTGPLHLGHARQAALGDALSSLLENQGFKVTREFYYNDAGEQIANLTASVAARLKGVAPGDPEWPEAAYNGEYVADIAQAYREGQSVEADDRSFKASGDLEDLAAIREFSVAYMRHEQDIDLRAFGVHFDHYFLESSLYRDGKVDAVVAALVASGVTYEHEGALWLRTTAFGDDKDRVMRKSNGSYTYFVPDVAYHVDKWQRGFHKVINIQGSDHQSTVYRVRAGLQGTGWGIPPGYPDYVLHKMVRVVRGGEEVKLSKRAGSYVTVRDLIDWVGRDAVRFFLVSRKADTEFTFDIDLALSQSEENPVYYVQYAHARVCSVLAQWKERDEGDLDRLAVADLSPLVSPREAALLQRLSEYPQVLAQATDEMAPHQLAFYLKDCAADFHSYYNAERVLVDDTATKLARLALLLATRQVLRNGLALLGVSAPDKM